MLPWKEHQARPANRTVSCISTVSQQWPRTLHPYLSWCLLLLTLLSQERASMGSSWCFPSSSKVQRAWHAKLYWVLEKELNEKVIRGEKPGLQIVLQQRVGERRQLDGLSQMLWCLQLLEQRCMRVINSFYFQVVKDQAVSTRDDERQRTMIKPLTWAARLDTPWDSQGRSTSGSGDRFTYMYSIQGGFQMQENRKTMKF